MEIMNKSDKGTKTKTVRSGRKEQRGGTRADMIINGSEQSIFLHNAE